VGSPYIWLIQCVHNYSFNFKRQQDQRGYEIFNTFFLIMDTQFSVVECCITSILVFRTVWRIDNGIASFHVGNLLRCVLEDVWIFGPIKN
jgi:hypothetical protein